MHFHKFSMYLMGFHGFQGQKVGGLWGRCGSLWQPSPGSKEEMLQSSNPACLEASDQLAGYVELAVLVEFAGSAGCWSCWALLEGGWNNEV